MDYLDIVKQDEEIRNDVLKHYDFAFRIVWANEHHRKIFMYIKSLTMYIRIKGFVHFGSAGIYFAIRFNDDDRTRIEEHVNKFRSLFKNENIETFKEENYNGCCIFTL